ncbi:hypothetical protein [uncultured Limosilactobacillus sp.]|uniref:hypothetical protein n=1 Tax=uncultured Limosilactobacillus sp. TaxID=2837629 RepID=UPI0025E58C11|nr:hypothetical protein [uncultured Limosilactobacillus sp.]
MTNGVTCESNDAYYIPFNGGKLVFLSVNGLTIPSDIRKTWMPQIGIIARSLTPVALATTNIKYDEQVFLGSDGTVAYIWHNTTINNSDTKGYNLDVMYFAGE